MIPGMRNRLFGLPAAGALICAALILVWTVTAMGQELPGAPQPPPAAGPSQPTQNNDSADQGRSEATSLLDDLDLQGLWQQNNWTTWLWLLIAIFLALAAGRILGSVLGHVAARFTARNWTVRSHVVQDLIGPARLALLTLGIGIGLAGVKMGGTLGDFSQRILWLLYSIAAFWYIFNLIAVIDVTLRRITAKTDSTLDDQFVPLIRKTLRVFLVVIGVLFVIDTVFQQDIGAWLAGLGIAGLAVSLAAQDSLKNLFGSITILLDRPFLMGERIVYSGYDGVIEEIGFRSTKVRTLTGHLVTIPNAKIVSDPIENIGRRKSIRRAMNVTITYDTSREKIEQAVQIVRGILDEDDLRDPIHQTIDGDEFPPRVYFNDYNAESLNIIVLYWYAPPAYWDYLDHAQRLNLRIFEEFERAGIEFAFPTQTIYLAGDPKREMAIKLLGKDL